MTKEAQAVLTVCAVAFAAGLTLGMIVTLVLAVAFGGMQ